MIRVLLVEDDKNLCFILKSSLEQMIGGYEVTTAPNGQEGLELLEQKTFDVIVSDVEMPVMDGLTMVQHIRRHHPRLAIIFITGLTTHATSSTATSRARTSTSRNLSCPKS